MCGIFGVFIRDDARCTAQTLTRTVHDLFMLAESRGKEASGLAVVTPDTLSVIKSPVKASTFIRTRLYQDTIARLIQQWFRKRPAEQRSTCGAMGHSRLVTTGSHVRYENNQPVITKESVGIHIGIIVNFEQLWERHASLERNSDVDSEILFALIQKELDEGKSLDTVARDALNRIQGVASIAAAFTRNDSVLLATNNGSLYMCRSPQDRVFLFASERYMLEQCIKRSYIRGHLKGVTIAQIEP